MSFHCSFALNNLPLSGSTIASLPCCLFKDIWIQEGQSKNINEKKKTIPKRREITSSVNVENKSGSVLADSNKENRLNSTV